MLKELLCDFVGNPLKIIDRGKPFSLFVDASDYAVGAYLAQPDGGLDKPVAFASCKFTPVQLRWSTIEKEAYAALWALHKFRFWVYDRHVILFSDSNPVTLLTESKPKNAKLMRWALAIQQFDVTFRYTKGQLNVVADC